MAGEQDLKSLSNDIQKLSKELSQLNSNFSGLVKSLPKDTMKTVAKSPTGMLNGTKDYTRSEDFTKKYQKESLIQLKDLVKTSKDMLKNMLKGTTMGLGKLLLLGGLLGFLLTGKGEFLNSMVKAFDKMFLLPVAKLFDKFIMGAAKSVPKFAKEFEKIFPNIAKGFSKQFEKIGSKLLDAGSKFGKFGKTFEKFGSKFYDIGGKLEKVGNKGLVKGGEEALKVGEKSGIKGISKLVGKGGLKALQKVPFLSLILGPALGLYFAYDRAKKGDWIGAFGELASGTLSMIPGVGIPLSLAMDAFLMLRDAKIIKPDAAIKGAVKGVGKGIMNVGKGLVHGIEGLAKIPFIGPIFQPLASIFTAISEFKAGKPLKAFGSLAYGVASCVPFLGPLMVNTVDIFNLLNKIPAVNNLSNGAASFGKKTLKGFGNGLKDSIMKPINSIKDAFKKFSSGDILGGLLDLGKFGLQDNPIFAMITIVKDIMKSIGGNTSVGSSSGSNHSATSSGSPSPVGIGKGVGDVPIDMGNKSPVSKVKNFVKKSFSSGVNVLKSASGSVGTFLKNAFRLASPDVDVKDLQPSLMNNLQGLAKDYFDATGKPLQINSGYRDIGKQQALYEKSIREGKLGMVAKPGHSMHNFGKAIDVQDGDYLENSGLLDKWGMWRPLKLGGSFSTPSTAESWHIEQKGSRSNISHASSPSPMTTPTSSPSPMTTPSIGSGIGDAAIDIINKDAINKEDYMNTISKLKPGAIDGDSIKDLIRVTKENGDLIQKAILGIKMKNSSTVSISNAG